jgi:hypothetical protein
MPRERKNLKFPRKGEIETRVVPVALFELLDVHEIQRGAASRWRGAARRGAARRGVAWCGAAWRGMARRGAAWRGVA